MQFYKDIGVFLNYAIKLELCKVNAKGLLQPAGRSAFYDHTQRHNKVICEVTSYSKSKIVINCSREFDSDSHRIMILPQKIGSLPQTEAAAGTELKR